jgi:hypothetical protein
MSSGVTLTAATRQNLLSLQGTADLVATTQNRLATGKKVNSALDSPTNFFTASGLSARSADLSGLLDGISNGIQTIQAANTGLTKLQTLTNSLKSTAQQALSASNAFTAKATSTSSALTGATVGNLLSTGATVAAGNNAVGTLTGATPPTAAVPAALTGSIDYKPTASATKLTGAVYTPTVPSVATSAGTAFTAPANAVAGTAVGGTYAAPAAAATLSITSGTGAAITVNLATTDTTAGAAVTKIQQALTTAGSTVTAAVGTGANAGKIVFTGATNGDSLNVVGSDANLGFGTNAGTSVTSTGQAAAATQTLTINNQAITISGGKAGDTAASVLTNAIASINAANTGASATGVSAAAGLGAAAGTIVLTGKADGSNFTASGSTANTLGFAANAAPTANGAPAASQTLTINGTQVNIAGGATQTQVLGLINAQSGTTGVTASQDTTDPTKIALTGKSDGSSFTVSSTNAASSGFAATPVTSSIAATVVGGVFAPTGTPATATGTPFTMPANAVATTATGTAFTLPTNAVAGTAVGGTFTAAAGNLSITSGAGGPIGVSLLGTDNLAAAVGKIQSALTTAGSTVTAAVGTGANTGKIVFTGATNGDSLNVVGTDANLGFGTNAGTSVTSTGQAAATSQTLTFGSGSTANTVTVAGGLAGSPAKTLADVVTAVNLQTGAAVNPTGVTAAINGAGTGLALSKSDGSSFTVTGGNASTGFATTPTVVNNGTAAASQTLTINGNAITINGGKAGDTAATVTTAALAAINAQTGAAINPTGVTATAVNGSLVLTGATTGTNFTVSGSANNTLGFASGAGTTTANGTPSGAQTLTVNGTDIAIASGASAAAAAAAINLQTSTTGVTAAVDPSTGHLALTGKADGTSFTVASSNPAASGFSGATTTVNGAPGVKQTLTINNTAISIPPSASLDDAIKAINLQSGTTGVTASKNTTSGANKLVLSGASDGSSFTVSGSAGNTLGLSSTPATVAGTLDPSATSLVSTLGFQANDNFSVNGQLVTIGANDTIASLVQKVGAATNGSVNASYDQTTNKFSFTAADANTAVTLADGSTATSKVANLGFTSTSFAAGLGAPGSASALSGKSLTVQVGSGANVSTTSITFGSAPGQISNLTQLNAALAPANAMATLDASTGKLSITTTNDYGADNLSVIASGAGNPFTTGNLSATVGGDGANTRNGLVTSYNNLLTQIDQLAADSGFNGINLLTGDNLKISFNEKGTSSLSVQGSAVSAASLGLNAVGSDTFQESSSINKVINQINSATTMLKSQASSLGSNLAVVQNRQDFSKQLINILDTGAANLTNADLNEEAANSQALSTRQSLGISALSLANQAQQGVLQLLR